MSKRKASSKDTDEGPSFEEALEGLESIVEAMEHEQLPLEDLVAYYEKGSKLMGRCETILESARERIELITLHNKDESELEKPIRVSDSAPDISASATSDDSDDDIRLF